MKVPSKIIWDDRLREEDRPFIDDLNAALDRLDSTRAAEIAVSDHLARSKVAWKITSYEHALLHRIVHLMDGVALGWNARNVLVATLCARAFMETFALFADLEARVTRMLKAEDLAGLDQIAQNGLFATRDPEWITAQPGSKAESVLKAVDRFDKVVEGFRGHYDILSELCHPDAAGHSHLFSRLDRTDGTIRFTDDSDPAKHAHLVLAAVAAFAQVEPIMTRLDATILALSEWHRKIAPVPGL